MHRTLLALCFIFLQASIAFAAPSEEGKAPATNPTSSPREHLSFDKGTTVEYYLEATLKDGCTVRWPETAPVINQTVLAWCTSRNRSDPQ